MPFGLANAPSTFQRMMDRIFGDLPNVKCYLDDLAIATKGTADDHMRDIQTVLDRLKDNQLHLNHTTNTQHLRAAMDPGPTTKTTQSMNASSATTSAEAAEASSTSRSKSKDNSTPSTSRASNYTTSTDVSSTTTTRPCRPRSNVQTTTRYHTRQSSRLTLNPNLRRRSTCFGMVG